jgi:ATP-dependent HslUV protease subunit HslV
MDTFHGTTIVCVRRETPVGVQVGIGGDGQVTLGHIVVQGTAEPALPGRQCRPRG